MTLKTSFSLAFLILLAACGKDRAAPTSLPLVQRIETQSAAEATKLAAAATITCSENCNPAVGLVVSTNDREVLSCTGSLVGKDLVLTNAHCLPSVVKLLPDLCSSQMQFILPSTGSYSEEKFHCKELLGFTPFRNASSPDLALLRISRSATRPALKVSAQGVLPGHIYSLPAITPDGRIPGGTLSTQTCTAVANNYLFPIYRSASDPLAVFANCESVAGNSGSPFLDSTGAIASVLQGSLPIGPEERTAWLPYLRESETDFSPMTLATSLICLKGTTWNWNPTCQEIDEEEIERPTLRDFLKSPLLNESIDAFLVPYLEKANALSWERSALRARTLEQDETLRPRCANRTQERVEYTLPRYRLKLLFNRYLQPAPAIEMLEEEKAIYSVKKITTDTYQIFKNGTQAGTVGHCPR